LIATTSIGQGRLTRDALLAIEQGETSGASKGMLVAGAAAVILLAVAVLSD
jgi:hypothetical protein